MAAQGFMHSNSTDEDYGSGSLTSPEVEVVAATFKVLVLGNSDVGKSSLIRVYTTGDVARNLLPTVGIDFTDIVVSVRGTKVKLRVWDTAGQERFFTFTKQFFRGTQGVLLMYDITSMASFQTLLMWLQTIKEMGLEGITIVVIGNKADLEEEREVPKKNGEKLSNKHGYQYIETSARAGTNVKKAFYLMAETLIYSHGIFQPGQEAAVGNTSVCSDESDDCHVRVRTPQADDSFRLDVKPPKAKSSKCCKS